MEYKKRSSFLKYITLTLSLFLFSIALFGQGWSFIFGGSSGNVGNTTRNDVIQIPTFVDGVFFPVSLYYESQHPIYHFTRVDNEKYEGSGSGVNPTGNDSFFDHLPKSVVMVDADTVIVLEDRIDLITGNQDLFLTQYYVDEAVSNKPFFIEWHSPVFEDSGNDVYGYSLKHTSDDNLIILGSVQSEVSGDSFMHDLLVVKTDLASNILWSRTYASIGNDLGIHIMEAADGGFWILKNLQLDYSIPETEMVLMKIDALGNLESETTIGHLNDVAFDVALTENGDFALTGHNENEQLFVLKIDMDGNEIWRQDYTVTDQLMTGHGIIEDTENHLVVVGKVLFETTNEQDAFLAKVTEHGTPLWEKTFGKPDKEDALNDIVLTPSGQYLMGGYRQSQPDQQFFHGYLIKTDTFGITKGFIVHGNVFQDLDENCLSTAGELNLENWKVQVANHTLNFFGHTDEQGNYWIPVDAPNGQPVDYIVSLIPPNNYWAACVNDIAISTSYLDTIAINFPMQNVLDCPFMNVQISNSNFRPCESADIVIQYCNMGTVVAENAEIEVNLDEYLAYTNSTITPSSIDGQTFVFPLGNIGVNECGTLNISALVACNSVEIGDVLCIETHITPDTICQNDALNWSGALLQVNYTCEDDEIQFNIENVGTNEMQEALEYIIIEDAVLLEQDNFNLAPAQNVMPNSFPIDGSTYHLIAQQEPGAPGPVFISLGANSCPNENSPLFNQFPQNSGDPFTVIHCPVVVGSFDPNDKQAIPGGFGEDHNILSNTDLQYTIRFQNTGTAAAFRVEIRDTLSNLLNPATIVPGPSSHPYNWRLTGEGVLIFDFYNIELPDSSSNFAASQGFVSFKIEQQNNLPEGTRIENNAAIYFDFNAPIITNTVFHTIADLIDIVIGSVTVADPNLELKVIPNPMETGAWIQLENYSEINEPISLQLFDLSGKLVRTLTGNTNNIWMERGDLKAGMYFFTIETKGEWLASGKIVIQ